MAIAEVCPVPHTPLDILNARHRRRESVLAEMVACASRAGAVRDAELLLETLAVRERLGATSLGKGVAIPHAHSIAVLRSWHGIARSHVGIEWRAPDELPVQLVWLVLTPSELSDEQHLRRVSSAAAALRLQRQRQRLHQATDAGAAVRLLQEWNQWTP